MLYKVTPMMAPAVPEKKVREPGQPRKKRKSAVFDHEGQEVLITLMCLKCKQMRPLMQFGLRKMADGAIRNQPWCRGCRSGAGAKKPAAEQAATPAAAPAPVVAAPLPLAAEADVAYVSASDLAAPVLETSPEEEEEVRPFLADPLEQTAPNG